MNRWMSAFRFACSDFHFERALHICVLCAFAFSEPLFAALTKQFVYLHDLKADWGEISFILLVLMGIVPAALIVLDNITNSVCTRFLERRGRDAVLFILMILVWLSILRPFLRIRMLESQSCTWIVSLILAVAFAVLTAWQYRRNPWVRKWTSVAAVAIVFFPGEFVWQFGKLQASQVRHDVISVKHPTPVIIVVFDEFSGTTLMDPELKIDSTHYPHFSRLASISTWYRNASTVHTRTDVAVPAILSGRFPTMPRPPLETVYPGNLFQVIQETDAFDVTIFEPITRLCPTSLEYKERIFRTRTQKLELLTQTLMSVYPHLILPSDTPIDFPPISKLWFGLPESPGAEPARISGLYRPNAFLDRGSQAQKFEENLRVTEKPAFRFMHIELPHLPWCFLPSGATYNIDSQDPFHPAGAWGDIHEDWDSDSRIIARSEHRYLLQVQFVDQLIGRLLDRLGEIGLLNQCLLVVTADHGVSFRPGHSRRFPDAENLSDLLSVPLFIKRPGQSSGEINDGNVESVDILPTIAEVLGLELPCPIDGIPVSTEKRRPRKSLFYESGHTILGPEIPSLKQAVERRWAVFGVEPFNRSPRFAATHPDWNGRKISEFIVNDEIMAGVSFNSQFESLEQGAKRLPCYVTGSIDSREFQGADDLLVAVNGVIRDSGTTIQGGFNRRNFYFFLAEEDLRELPCQLDLYQVQECESPGARLRRIGSETLQATISRIIPQRPVKK